MRRTFLKRALTAVFAAVAIAPPAIADADIDTTAPAVCVSSDDLKGVEQRAPQVFRDFSLMRKLALTGAPVFQQITDPAGRMEICLFPVPAWESSFNVYSNGRAEIARGSSSLGAMHEYYHAAQDIQSGGDDLLMRLKTKDAVVGFLLLEAAALAYELALLQEAENNGVELFFKKQVKVINGDGSKTYSFSGIAMMPDVRGAFLAAYNETWLDNVDGDDKGREEKALSAGGKAVVRHLLEGKNASWAQIYRSLAARNLNSNVEKRAQLCVDCGDPPGYGEQRRRIYLGLGAVGGKISFVPDEYLDKGAERSIDGCFRAMGFVVKAADGNHPRLGPDPKI